MTTKKPKRPRWQGLPSPILTSTVPDRVRDPDDPHMVGYVRVSTSDQSVQRQVDELVKYGVAAVDIYKDTASGRDLKRPGWFNCNRVLQPGDVLVVHSLERLGRNLLEVIQIEQDLRAREVTLKVLAQDINTGTAAGRMVFHILMTVSQFEREWGLERTMHGLQKARERGVTGGSTPIHSDEEIEKALMAAGGPEKTGAYRDAARALKYKSKGTVMRRWKMIEQKRRKERTQ